MKFTILLAILPLLASAAPTIEPQASQLGPAISSEQAIGDQLFFANINNDHHQIGKRAIKETYYVDLSDKTYMWVFVQDTTAGTSRWERRRMLSSGGPTYASAAVTSASKSSSVSVSVSKSSVSSVSKAASSSVSVSKAAISSASSKAVVPSSSSKAPVSSASVSVSKPATSSASSKAVVPSSSSKAPASSSSASVSKAVVSSASSKAAVSSSSSKAAVSSASSKAAVSSSSSKAAVSSSSSKAVVPSSSSKAAVSSSSSKAVVPSSSSKAVVPSSSSKAAVSSSSSKAVVPSSSSKAAVSSSSAKPAVSSTSKAAALGTTSAVPTSTGVPASATGGVSAADQTKYLSLHNNFRARYSAGTVTWDDSLAAFALKTAQTCKYGHTGGPYGENIAAGVGGGYNIDSAFNAWANEDALYDFNKPGYSSATGHFTQIVWKGTAKIGCASASCADGTIFTGYRANSTYVVCEYQTPGNIVSSDPNRTAEIFRSNVGPKV